MGLSEGCFMTELVDKGSKGLANESTNDLSDKCGKSDKSDRKPEYVVEIGKFKLTGADTLNLSSLSLILYLTISSIAKEFLNSKLILTLSIIVGSLFYWVVLSFLQTKSITKNKADKSVAKENKN